MMQPKYVATPAFRLFRIGRYPDPMAWAPWDRVGDGRYDDPRLSKRYRVLYAGERRACFLESLAKFRPDLFGKTQFPLSSGWIARRGIAEFSLEETGSTCQWLDMRATETLQFCRTQFATSLIQHGIPDFDLSLATSKKLEITQEIGQWAFDTGCYGIVYPTRFAVDLACWAIFERTDGPQPVRTDVQPLSPDDQDFITVCTSYAIPIPADAP